MHTTLGSERVQNGSGGAFRAHARCFCIFSANPDEICTICNPLPIVAYYNVPMLHAGYILRGCRQRAANVRPSPKSGERAVVCTPVDVVIRGGLQNPATTKTAVVAGLLS